MKRLIFAVFFILSTLPILGQTMVQLVSPQYFCELTPFRVRISGLKPSTQYKVAAGMVDRDQVAAENPDQFALNQKGHGFFYLPEYSTGGVMQVAPSNGSDFIGYTAVTSDAAGQMVFWVVITGDATDYFNPRSFNSIPGTRLQLSVLLNDGTSSNTIATRLVGPDELILSDLGGTASSITADNCCLIKGISASSPGYVLIWDNIEGSGRPLHGGMIENNGLTENSASARSKISVVFIMQIDAHAGYYDVVYPVNNTSGLRRIEVFNADGTSRVSATSTNGFWPSSGLNTTSLAAGTTYTMTGADVSLPIELTGFDASLNQTGNVILSWQTATEVNCHAFEVQKLNGEAWKNIGEVRASGTSNVAHNYQFIDRNLETGTNVYRLKTVDNDGSFQLSSITSLENTLPLRFSVSQNYPNPFNPSTTFDYNLPEKAFVNIIVFDAFGRQVAILKNEEESAGRHSLLIDATRLSSGAYFYRLTAGQFARTKKMILMK